jgi:streptogramin lyase
MRIWTRALLTAAALLALAPAGVMAAPAHDGTFDVTGAPKQISQGPDGNLWVVLSGGTKEYARVTPDGTVTEFDAPPGIAALEDVTSGPNNHVWFSATNNVVEVDPANATAPTAHSFPQIAGARGIVQGSDGNLWVVELDGLVKVGPNGAFISEHLVPGSSGRGITLGSDGRVWWADFGNGNVRATDTAGVTTNYTGSTKGLQEIAAGPAGQVAFTQQAGQPYELGRTNTADGSAQLTTEDREPFGIDFGTDGAYWVAEFATDSVGRFTTDGQLTHPITLPAGSGPRYIARGPNNTLWVTAETSKKILRISGVVAEQPQPTTPQPTTPDPTGPTVTPDTAAPVLSQLKLSLKTRRVTLRLDEPAELTVFFDKKVKRGGKNVWKKVRGPIKKQGKAGLNRVAFNKFKKGSYRVRVLATDVVGNKTAKAKTLSFKVK